MRDSARASPDVSHITIDEQLEIVYLELLSPALTKEERIVSYFGNKIRIFIAVLCVLILNVGSCQDDIVGPGLSGIEGEFRGVMVLTKELGSGMVEIVDSLPVHITFIISDANTHAGVYSAQWETSPEFCNTSRGTWQESNGKALLKPIRFESVVCDYGPLSLTGFAGASDELSFQISKNSRPPFDSEIGDTLILSQLNSTTSFSVVFELVLVDLPAT